MPSHSEALARIQEQLTQQSTEWREICRALQAFDPCAALPVSDELLAQIDAVCSERVPAPRAATSPLCGIRA